MPASDPYAGMSDQELMSLAKRTLFDAATLKPRTIERVMKFAAYDSITNEIKRRMALRLNEGLSLPDIDL